MNRWITLIFLLLLFASCKSVKPVPVETVHEVHTTDTVREVQQVFVERQTAVHDTVKETVTERVVVTVSDSGDTVRTDVEKVYVRDAKLVIENALLQAEVDSLRSASKHTEYIEVPKVVEVERQMTAWQRFRIGAFWWLVGAIALSAIWIKRTSIFELIKRI